jgi:hypothetical protein
MNQIFPVFGLEAARRYSGLKWEGFSLIRAATKFAGKRKLPLVSHANAVV